MEKVTLVKRRWLSEAAFEVELTRPRGFKFLPGQRIRLDHDGAVRDYSLISAPGESSISLCVRRIDKGHLSVTLAGAEPGARYGCTGPFGYFTFRPSRRPAVFVATGTGIAPFVSMARAGINRFMLLHGAKTSAALYYETLLRTAGGKYVPCLSAAAEEYGQEPAKAFPGRVTEYLAHHLRSGEYDFYLCGRSEMIREVTLLIDDRFPGSFVYTEIFY